MKIVIDKALTMITGVFEPFASVAYMPGSKISRADILDADALITRTRTRCDKEFTQGSKLKIIATATIGHDHIDTGNCAAQGIETATAAGSNARSVAQYVFAAIIALRIEPAGKTLGVIGVGNIGSIVSEVAKSAGFNVLENDPPREAREKTGRFIPLKKLLNRSDIVTIHVPLDSSTKGMVSEDFIRNLKPGTTLINTSRGGIITNEAAVIAARRSGHIGRLAIDVWNNEPDINPELLKIADIATPHIAGYSLQGRANASAMAVHAVARRLGISELSDWYPADIMPSTPRPDISWGELVEKMPSHYDIMADDRDLRADPAKFERLRDNYNFRQEFF